MTTSTHDEPDLADIRASDERNRNRLSWLTMNCYRTCPLKWQFQYVEQRPEESVPAARCFAGAMREAILEYWRAVAQGFRPGIAWLFESYYSQVAQAPAGAAALGCSEDEETSTELARKMLTAFLQQETHEPKRIVAVGQQVSGPLIPGGPELQLRLDLVTRDERDQLMVTALRISGRRWSTEQAEQNSDELRLARELLSELHPSTDIKLRYLVLTNTRIPQVDRVYVSASPATRQRLSTLLAQLERAMANEIVYPSPSLVHCPSCAYRQACRSWPRVRNGLQRNVAILISS